jgi:hypothetical protein
MASMDYCTGMDMMQPGLCQAHDHVGQQSLDKPDLQQVLPFHAISSVLTVVLLDAAALPPSAASVLPSLAHATAPPVAIRHCCFPFDTSPRLIRLTTCDR